MLACRIERGLGLLALLAMATTILGCSCTDDALPTCNPPTLPQTQASPQLGGLLAGVPAAPGPGPIKPQPGYRPGAVDVVFVLDDTVVLPEPGAPVDALHAFQFLADQLVWQLTAEMGLGLESDYDVAYGLGRLAEVVDPDVDWPFAVVQPPLQPGGEVWDGVWSDTAFTELPALVGEAGWRDGASRLVVVYSNRPIEEIPAPIDVDDVVVLNPLLEDASVTALNDLGEAVGALQAAPRVPAQDEAILGYVYYDCVYAITNPSPELVLNPVAGPIIPVGPESTFYVSQSADGTRQVVRVPIYADDLPPEEIPDPVKVQWVTGFERADDQSTNAISTTANFLMTFRLSDPSTVPGGANPTVDVGTGVDIPDNLQSTGQILVEFPEIVDPNAPPTNTSTLVSVSGEPVLFLDTQRVGLGSPYDEDGPYSDGDTPVP